MQSTPAFNAIKDAFSGGKPFLFKAAIKISSEKTIPLKPKSFKSLSEIHFSEKHAGFSLSNANVFA